MLDFSEIDFVVVFLKETDDVGFWVLFDVSLVVSWLRVVDVLERLDLSYWVDVLDFSKDDLTATFFVLEKWAEEVGSLWSMVKNGGAVQFVA